MVEDPGYAEGGGAAGGGEYDCDCDWSCAMGAKAEYGVGCPTVAVAANPGRIDGSSDVAANPFNCCDQPTYNPAAGLRLERNDCHAGDCPKAF